MLLQLHSHILLTISRRVCFETSSPAKCQSCQRLSMHRPAHAQRVVPGKSVTQNMNVVCLCTYVVGPSYTIWAALWRILCARMCVGTCFGVQTTIQRKQCATHDQVDEKISLLANSVPTMCL